MCIARVWLNDDSWYGKAAGVTTWPAVNNAHAGTFIDICTRRAHDSNRKWGWVGLARGGLGGGLG